MLQPKKTKHRKMHKMSFAGKAKGNKFVAFGDYGLMATTGAWITGNQLEAARVVLSKNLGKTGKMWMRVFPQMPYSKHPIGVRMGSGKGDVQWYVAVVKAGTIMFEIGGVDPSIAKDALRKAGNKLSVVCKVVSKKDTEKEVNN